VKVALVISFCSLSCACADGGTKYRSEPQAAALKTCNKYLNPRMNGKSVEIPSDSATFELLDNAVVVRWSFDDGDTAKIGECTTSLDGKTFRSAQALPDNT
jgi:hypothetical protein